MKKVMAFGTFDYLHPGHLSFLKQARQLGDHLIVVVARDKTVKMVKGHLPRFTENQRLQAIKKIKLADVVTLGDLVDYYQPISTYQPQVIALGYDQNSFIQDLAQRFPNMEIVRLRPYKPEIYKSSKIKIKNYGH